MINKGETYIHIKRNSKVGYMADEIIGKIIKIDKSTNILTVTPILTKITDVHDNSESKWEKITNCERMIIFIDKKISIVRYLDDDALSLEFFDILL